MYIVFYNLKRLFKWIFNTTNRKWRDRTNGKNVGKVKIRIFCIDVIYGVDGMGGAEWKGEGRGVHKLTSKEYFPSPILNFESPLAIIHMCSMRNHCISIRYFQYEKTTYWWKQCIECLNWKRQKTKGTYFANSQWLWIKFSFDSHKLKDLFGSVGIQQK